jgi:hypothetical protein
MSTLCVAVSDEANDNLLVVGREGKASHKNLLNQMLTAK